MTTPLASYVCNNGANPLLDLEFGQVAATVARTDVYFGLSTQPANKGGFARDVFGLGSVVGGGGYYPAIVANNLTTWAATSASVKTNAIVIRFPQAPTTDWGSNIAGVITPADVVSMFEYSLGPRASSAITTTLLSATSITFAASGSTSGITIAAGVLPGMLLTLSGSGTPESIRVPTSWIPGSSATVPLVSAVAHAGQTTVAYDTLAGNVRRYWDIAPVRITSGAAAPSIAIGALSFIIG